MPRTVTAALAAALIAGGAGTARAETLSTRLMPLIQAHQGTVAVAVKHLKTGEELYFHADDPMPTASLIKVAVMVET